MEHDIHADGASRQLGAIHAGGHHLIAIARQRIGSALDEMDAGDFTKAMERLNAAVGCIGPLANAQTYIAIADGSKMIRAADLKAGMTITDVGEVSEIEIEDCPSPQCRRHITVKVGDHDLHFHGDTELYVAVPDEEDD